MTDLSDFAHNVYSQYGEDGIIWEILDRLDRALAPSKWCVELGAWDGQHLSNTCNLIRNRGYNAVLIEGDPKRVQSLQANHPAANVEKVCCFVFPTGNSTLESVLRKTSVPIDFDLLSIDVDGIDYWILDSLSEYRPRLILIEFNPTVPNSVSYVQSPDPSIKRGASAHSLTQLGKSKGYELVAATHCNIFLVRSDLIAKIGFNEVELPTIKELRDDSDSVVHAFVGYDGTLVLEKGLKLPWHGLTITSDSVQPLPRIFRKYPGDWGRRRFLLFRLFRLIRRKRFQGRQ